MTSWTLTIMLSSYCPLPTYFVILYWRDMKELGLRIGGKPPRALPTPALWSFICSCLIEPDKYRRFRSFTTQGLLYIFPSASSRYIHYQVFPLELSAPSRCFLSCIFLHSGLESPQCPGNRSCLEHSYPSLPVLLSFFFGAYRDNVQFFSAITSVTLGSTPMYFL